MSALAPWPALPLEAWRETYTTLHLWMQIVGKTCLALAPMENHWWQIAFHITPRGLSTSALPSRQRVFSVEFDFIDHVLVIRVNDGSTRSIPLAARSVAAFYRDYRAALRALGIHAVMRPAPVEMETAVPFGEDLGHASYDADAARRCWHILTQTDRLLRRFRGRFLGKSSPSHFFWGSFDLAHTRFSGRRAPRHPGGAPHCPDYVMVEAYSHECSSCGFWPGGAAIAEPAFYAYAYPPPPGYAESTLQPTAARFDSRMQEFILPYEIVRNASAPDDMLLQFFQSAYEAAAERGDWDRAALERVLIDWP